MKNTARLFMVFLAISFSFGLDRACSQEVWVTRSAGASRSVDARDAAADKNGFYLATRNEVYKVKDINEKWESVFFLSPAGNEITCLGTAGKNIFVGTRRGLFRSSDCGRTWKSVFRTVIPDKNNVLSLAVSAHDPKTVIIGTKKGVFISGDDGDRWEDITDNLRGRSAECIVLDGTTLYAAGSAGLYKRKLGSDGWERLFVKKSVQGENGAGEPEEREEIDESDSEITCIVIRNTCLFLSDGRKIVSSNDGGKTWQTFPCEGLSGGINHMLPSSKTGRFHCATSKGVFEYGKDKNRWLELYRGMGKSLNVNKIAFENEGEERLLALSDKGVFVLEGGRYFIDSTFDIERSFKRFKIVSDAEPGLKELQKAAIRFAEVSPEKILNWRREARLRALLPKVSVGMSRSNSSNSEIYTSATKDYIVVGPEDVSKNLNVSVSWELGDIIWSDDQTNIDVRSRLMVQLRNDILDDLRRVYYERKRIQLELMTGSFKDFKIRSDKEMRLEELTSAIDDLTDNYLSDRIRKGPVYEAAGTNLAAS